MLYEITNETAEETENVGTDLELGVRREDQVQRLGCHSSSQRQHREPTTHNTVH